MDQRLLNLISAKKQKEAVVQRLLRESFTHQVNFVSDGSKRKVALCTRRAAKSYSCGLMFCIIGLTFPNSTMTYATMTLQSAKKIMLKDIVNPLNEKHGLGLDVVGSAVRFPNGSVIYLVGVDKDEDQKNKLLGQKNKLFVLDEAQDITIDIPDLLERVVDPTLLDNNGQLVMVGTPSDNTNTYFYKITQDYKSRDGWNYHSWSCFENPFCKDQIEEEIARKEAIDPLYRTRDVYKQMWEGKWVISKNALIYKPNPRNFDVDELPEPNENYIWLLGIDLGYVDADGFVIGAYSLTDRCLYIVDCIKQTGNDDIATGQTIRRLNDRFGFHRMVIDGSNLKAVETMRQRFQLPLVAADKAKKADYIRMFNMDLDAGLIKILPKAQDLLVGTRQNEEGEWRKLIWDPKRPGKEKAGLDNHVSDACLYLWRSAGNWASVEPDTKIYTEEELYNKEMDDIFNKPKTTFGELEDRLSFNRLKDTYD